MTERAERIVISYPADLSEWGRGQLDGRVFRAYLRRKLGGRENRREVRTGEEWAEFVDVGCCGSTYDVPLRIERVEGGAAVGPDTEIEYAEREACGVAGGWEVQSAAGPRRERKDDRGCERGSQGT